MCTQEYTGVIIVSIIADIINHIIGLVYNVCIYSMHFILNSISIMMYMKHPDCFVHFITYIWVDKI